LAPRHHKALLFRSVNERIASLAADLSRRSVQSDFEFHCECGTCQEWVMLPVDRFLAIADEPGAFVLAPDHPVPRARRARQEAAELREEAEALRAQAEHQKRRARNHVDPE